MTNLKNKMRLAVAVAICLAALLTTSCERYIEVTGITLNKSTLTLEVGQWETLIATVTPAKATNKTVIWTIVDGTSATVVDGIVTALPLVGKTTVVAKAGNYIATCEVTVVLKSVAGTTWTGYDYYDNYNRLKFTNATNCTLYSDAGNFSGTYTQNNTNMSVKLPGYTNFSGTINSTGTMMTLKSGSYTIDLTKQ